MAVFDVLLAASGQLVSLTGHLLAADAAQGEGDAVLFCTRDRLLKVGGAYGLQPVKHGAERVESGTRFVLAVPFHEYR